MVGIDGKDVVSLSSSVVSVSDTSAGSSAAAIGGRGMANVNITPHRAHLARDTHTIFLVCTRLQFWSPPLDRIFGFVVLTSLKSHSISTMFHRTFVYLSFVVVSFDVSIHCHSARRVMLWPTG